MCRLKVDVHTKYLPVLLIDDRMHRIVKAESELRNSLPRGISCDRIEALQSGVSTFVFDSMKRFGRASLPDDFWVRLIRFTSFFPPNFGRKIKVRLVLKSG